MRCSRGLLREAEGVVEGAADPERAGCSKGKENLASKEIEEEERRPRRRPRMRSGSWEASRTTMEGRRRGGLEKP